jgi:hypothetical protein
MADAPTKLIISGDLRFAREAFDLLQREAADFAEYDRIGWGWSFGPYDPVIGRSRFFVRRIKDGLSCAIMAPAQPDPDPEINHRGEG